MEQVTCQPGRVSLTQRRKGRGGRKMPTARRSSAPFASALKRRAPGLAFRGVGDQIGEGVFAARGGVVAFEILQARAGKLGLAEALRAEIEAARLSKLPLPV